MLHKFLMKLKNLNRITKAFLKVFFVAVMILLFIALWRGAQERKMQRIINKYAPEGYLIYGADDSAPPLRYIDKADGQYKGACVDYINLISLEMGVKIVCKPYRWEEALIAVSTGKTDMCDMFASKERGKTLVFSNPMFSLRTILVCRKGVDYQLKDIDSLKVATQKGDWANSYLATHYPNSKQVFVHDVGEGLDLLLKNEVDAVIGDEPVVQFFASEKNIQDKINPVNTALYEEPVVLGVRKEKEELLIPLNDAIAKVVNRGNLEKVQQRWFGISTSMIKQPLSFNSIIKYVIAAILLAVAVVLFKLFENRSLRREVKKRTQQLENHRNELNMMLNEIPEGIIVLNAEKKIQHMNTLALKLVDAEGHDLLGSSFADYFQRFDSGSNIDFFSCFFNDVSKDPIKINKGKSIYEFRDFPIASDDGHDKNWMVTIKDITLDEIRNSELLQSSKMMAVGQLAAGMAHQLRNPLGIIRTQSYILRKGMEQEGNSWISLNYIDDSVQRASVIIDNVMNFWRISDSEESHINLYDYIESIVLLNGDEIKKKHIHTQVICDSSICLCCNQESLKHIIMNILQNAVESINHEQGNIIIFADLIDNSTCKIMIKDNGMGIDEEHLPSLFNPFFTTKPPGKGTGLGLYVAYNEAKNLGGTIDIESKKGLGTTFTIIIPLKKS